MLYRARNSCYIIGMKSWLLAAATLSAWAAFTVSCSDNSRQRGWSALSSGITTSTATAQSSSSSAGGSGGEDPSQSAGGAASSSSAGGIGGMGGLGGAGGSGGSAPTCIGPTPPQDAWMAMPGPVYGGGGMGGGLQPGTPTIGQSPPPWLLPDVQPLACGSGATYGMETFLSTVTVAVLLAGW